MYQKGKAPLMKITYANMVKVDTFGMNSIVGGLSNKGIQVETVKALFTKPEQKEQLEELETRKKMLRYFVGEEIDRIKNCSKKIKIPDSWTKFEKVNEFDDDITKAEKYRHNSLVISKKPYFFRYLYPELNKKYKQYERSYNEVSRCMFGMKFKKLLAKENKTEMEMRLVRRYHKFSPLINSNCTMNILCREFEDVDFNIQYDKETCNMLPTYEGEFEADENIVLKLRDMYRKYSNKKAVAYLNTLYDPTIQDDDYNEIKYGILDAVREGIREELDELELTPKETLFYIGQLAKRYAKFNWGFAWDIMGDSILDCIEYGETVVPVEDENGEEYLGKRYVLKRIKNPGDIAQEDCLEEDESDIEDIFDEEEEEESDAENQN